LRFLIQSVRPAAVCEGLAFFTSRFSPEVLHGCTHESTEGGHGRIDTRKVWATDQIDWLKGTDQWEGLKSVVTVESIRRVIGTEKPTVERRHYLASVPCTERAGRSSSGERFAGLVRNHWSIENGQHWTLDMAFNEDQSRVRKNHGQENMAIMRRLALGLLRRDKSVKVGAKNKRLKAARNPDYLSNRMRVIPGVYLWPLRRVGGGSVGCCGFWGF
jgi:hypothetical protein